MEGDKRREEAEGKFNLNFREVLGSLVGVAERGEGETERRGRRHGGVSRGRSGVGKFL